MNLDHQEKTLIKDIFNVRVTHQPGDSQSIILLENFPKQIANLGNKVSLVQNSTYFDSLLMERLQIPNTDSLAYLEECLGKCQYILEKPWNQSQLCQSFIKYSIEIINNFIYLTQTNPQIFPDQYQIDQQAAKSNNPMISLAMRLITHFERRGYNTEILNIFYPKVNNDINGNFAQSFIEVLIARQRFLTILDSKAFFYITCLENVLTIPEFKEKFLSLNVTKFIPEETLKMPGSKIDRQSPLGLFLRLSVMGNLYDYFHQEKQAVERFEKKMREQFGSDRLTRDRMKYYGDLQNQFYSKHTELFKLLLKKDSQKMFLEWNYRCILSNLNRTKLGMRLQSAKNDNISHDGMMINLYVCMLNLCKPLFNRESGKYKSIDPQYYVYNRRTQVCKYEKLNTKDAPKIHEERQFGTITEFFFLTLEYLHVGLIPSQENFTEALQRKDKIQKLLNNPQYKGMEGKIKFQIEQIRSLTMRYYIVLLDENLIRATVKLFDLLLQLIPRWLQFDYESLRDCKMMKPYKTPELARFLPEHFLDSIYKFHLGAYKIKPNYIQILGEEHIHQILKVTCLMLSLEDVVSNPYLAANFVELLFYFLYQNKSGLMYEVFKTNLVAHQNLTFSLIRFYNDIAVTGSSHQFYSKFKYRFFVNKIFTNLWQHQVYRTNLKAYFKTEVFERFLNMAMGDTTYCFDQTNQNYATFKELQNKKQYGKLSPEDQRNQENLSQNISATLSQSTSNLKLLKQLSNWSPQTFFSEAFLSDIVLLINNILQTFVDPTSFVANRQLLAKYKFEKDLVLSDLVQIYVNLDISQKFASEIVKDARFFKKQNFSRALQRASNQHQTNITTLQKFEELIGKLQTTFNEEEDDEIYGQIPQKYLCSLMSTLMKEPVELPSGETVDRVYIHKHLLNDERNPFTRAPMKNGQWKELKDLKDEIEVWKKKRLEELKGANKEVKYGKIGINKKEEEEDVLYADKRINIEDEEMD